MAILARSGTSSSLEKQLLTNAYHLSLLIMTARPAFCLLAAGFLALNLLSACKRKPVSEPTALPAPPPSTATTPEQAVAELNKSLELWTFQRNQPPKDLNELVTAGYLQRLPTAPAGKKFALDPVKMRVQLVAE